MREICARKKSGQQCRIISLDQNITPTSASMEKAQEYETPHDAINLLLLGNKHCRFFGVTFR
tara:strand:+ start:759 stop:944 length:186 start_codon:yes stop_codon:yes gene_type:complete